MSATWRATIADSSFIWSSHSWTSDSSSKLEEFPNDNAKEA